MMAGVLRYSRKTNKHVVIKKTLKVINKIHYTLRDKIFAVISFSKLRKIFIKCSEKMLF